LKDDDDEFFELFKNCSCFISFQIQTLMEHNSVTERFVCIQENEMLLLGRLDGWEM